MGAGRLIGDTLENSKQLQKLAGELLPAIEKKPNKIIDFLKRQKAASKLAEKGGFGMRGQFMDKGRNIGRDLWRVNGQLQFRQELPDILVELGLI